MAINYESMLQIQPEKNDVIHSGFLILKNLDIKLHLDEMVLWVSHCPEMAHESSKGSLKAFYCILHNFTLAIDV